MSKRASIVLGILGFVGIGVATPAGAVGIQIAQISWDDLSPTQRNDALQNLRRHQLRPEREKREVLERYERWKNLPPDKRERYRQRFQQYQTLPPAEKARLRERLDLDDE